MSDVIDIQKDIATSVAARLQASMSSEGPISIRSEEAVSPEAYALYLRAVSLSPYGKTRNLAEPQALLERVVEMAPDFAPGWTRLAAVHGRRAVYGDPGYDLTKEETLLITGHAIRRAFELDPENGEIYAFLGGAAWVFERDLVKAAPLIERAIALDPWNLDFISFAADFAKNIGRLDDALELEQVLVVRDPLCNTCRLHLALSYLYAQRYGDATTQYRLLQSINGGYHWTLGVLALLQEEPEMAIEEFENLAADAPLRALGQAMAWHDLGRLEDSRRALAGVEGRAGNVSPIMLAETLAYVGERDRAFEWLDRSLPADTLVMQTSFPHPLFNSLHADPRWSELLRRIGRSPDDLDEIPFSLDGPRARLGLPDR